MRIYIYWLRVNLLNINSFFGLIFHPKKKKVKLGINSCEIRYFMDLDRVSTARHLAQRSVSAQYVMQQLSSLSFSHTTHTDCHDIIFNRFVNWIWPQSLIGCHPILRSTRRVRQAAERTNKSLILSFALVLIPDSCVCLVKVIENKTNRYGLSSTCSNTQKIESEKCVQFIYTFAYSCPDFGFVFFTPFFFTFTFFSFRLLLLATHHVCGSLVQKRRRCVIFYWEEISITSHSFALIRSLSLLLTLSTGWHYSKVDCWLLDISTQ